MVVGIFRKISDILANALQGKGPLGALLPAIRGLISAASGVLSASGHPIAGAGLNFANNTLGDLMNSTSSSSSIPTLGSTELQNQTPEVSSLIKFKKT